MSSIIHIPLIHSLHDILDDPNPDSAQTSLSTLSPTSLSILSDHPLILDILTHPFIFIRDWFFHSYPTAIDLVIYLMFKHNSLPLWIELQEHCDSSELALKILTFLEEYNVSEEFVVASGVMDYACSELRDEGVKADDEGRVVVV